ncbi:MAG: hypothetical protein E7379_03850 [Clostridiales bacterium]|nr:hypothetical protein [Clostridiales bacterium]
MEKGIISFGQHYLENVQMQETLINSADLKKDDVVVEIGAGDGRITRLLGKKAKKVVAYEIDEKTKDVLVELQKEQPNIEIVFQNFLEARNLEGNKLVSSLPYQITEPFLEKIKSFSQFERITLLVGKTFGKFADENASQKISKLYLLFRCYFKGEYICDVAKENFNPPPNTMSSIINIYPKAKEDLLSQPSLYVMREVFEQRDKKVSNALREAIIRLFAQQNVVKTKRETKQLLQENFSDEIIDNYLEQMNNDQIAILFAQIEKLFN